MRSIRSQCEDCRHFRPHFRGRTSCDAYPDDIPVEIKRNWVDHRLPYVGDHGIQYGAIHPQDGFEDGVGSEDDDRGLPTE